MPDFTSLQLPIWAIVLLMVLAWLSREGVGAYLKWRAARMEESKADDQRNLAGYIELIGELRGRVGHLEGVLVTMGDKYEQTVKTLRDEHIACLKVQAEQSAEIAVLKDEVKGLRDWRHEVASTAHVATIKKAIDDKLTSS